MNRPALTTPDCPGGDIADAVFAAEFGLPANPPPPDPDLVDQIAVERRLAGDRSVRLNRAEFLVVVDVLTRRGRSAAEIAEVLGTTGRSVVRARRALVDQASSVRLAVVA